MRCFLLALSLLCTACVGLAGSPATALEKLDATVPQDITVLADPSLTVPLIRIARRYGALYNVPVSTSFGSSKQHISQVKEGQEGNVFITAKAAWMKQMQQEGLIDVYSRTTIARNRLAIVSSLARGRHAASLTELALLLINQQQDAMFALGDPEYVAEGTYTLQALSHYKLAGDFEPNFSILRNSYQLKNTVANYDAYGAIFYSDAVLYPDVALLEPIEEKAHEPILYQAAVIVGDNMEQASHFLNFLKNAEAQAIFREYGFSGAY